MLVHRANSIDHWVEDCKDVTKAGEGGYVQRMEVIVKRKKVRVGVRVDVNGEVKLLWKFQKKFFLVCVCVWGGGGRVEGGGGGGSGWM